MPQEFGRRFSLRNVKALLEKQGSLKKMPGASLKRIATQATMWAAMGEAAIDEFMAHKEYEQWTAEQKDAAAARLHKLRFFQEAHVSLEMLTNLLHTVKHQRLSAGEFIFHQADRTVYFYVIGVRPVRAPRFHGPFTHAVADFRTHALAFGYSAPPSWPPPADRAFMACCSLGQRAVRQGDRARAPEAHRHGEDWRRFR